MNTNSKAEKSSTSHSTTRRYWARTDTPKPWFPWGLLQVLWLGLLLLFGALLVAPKLQADVGSQVGGRLLAAGIASARVTADGQTVSVFADAGETNEMAVHTIAESTQCRTWAGNLPCPTTVEVVLNSSARDIPAVAPRLHEFMIVRNDDSVTLSGEVPNIVEYNRMLDAAGQQFENVVNELQITNETATDAYTKAADGAIAVAGELIQGHARWSAGSLHVMGFASAEGVESARRHFRGAGDDSMPGDFSVRSLNAPDQCNQQFSELLVGNKIQFQTSSASIDDRSQPLLVQLQRVATNCAGEMTVEGHTDSRGATNMNKALSQARADSVRSALIELGVEANRLSAVGFGEELPIADNETASGRAMNRRIEITIKTSQQDGADDSTRYMRN